MNKLLTRISAFLLIPCLIADPVTAAGFQSLASLNPPVHSTMIGAVFQEQALIAEPLGDQRSWYAHPFVRVSVILTITGGVAAAWAHARHVPIYAKPLGAMAILPIKKWLTNLGREFRNPPPSPQKPVIAPEVPANEIIEPVVVIPTESPEIKAQKRKQTKKYLSQIDLYQKATAEALERVDLDKAQEQLALWASLQSEIQRALHEGVIDLSKELELADIEFTNLQNVLNTRQAMRQRIKDEAEARARTKKDRRDAEKARREAVPVEEQRPVVEVVGPAEQEHPKEGTGTPTVTSQERVVDTPIQRETKPVRLAAERNPYLLQLSALRDGQRAVDVEDLEKAEIYLPQVGDVPGSTQLLADVAALRRRKEAILKDARQALESGDIAKTTSLAAQTRGAVGYAQLIVDLEAKRQQQVAILATGREALQARDYEKARAQALDLAAVNNPGGPKLLADIEAVIAQEKERAEAQPRIDRINTLTQEIDKNLPMVRPPYPQVIRDLLLPNDRAVALLRYVGSATQDCRDFLITELESAAIAKRFEQGPDDEPQIPGEIRRILIKSQLTKFLPILQPKYRREIENILQSGKRLGSSLLIIGKATQGYDFKRYPLSPDSSAEIVESFQSDKNDHVLAADVLHILLQAAFKAGESAYAEGRYGDAVEDFNNAAPYPGAAAALEQAQAAFATQKAAYEKGEQAFGESRYGEAIEAFQQAGSYPGAAERIAEAKVPFAAQEIDFKTGERAYQESRYREAEIAFRKAASYPGASERLADTKAAQRRSFEAGRAAHQENRLGDAVAELEKAGPYQGAKQRLEKVKAALAVQAVAFQAGRVAYRKGLYRDAVAAFQTAGTYPGAIEALEQAQAVFTTQKTAYEEGEQAFGDHRYGDAQAAFQRAGSYPDAKQRLNKELVTLVAQEAAYRTGEQANTEKRYVDAVAAFKKAGSYPGGAEALELAQAALGIQAQFFKAGERAYRKSNYREAETAFRKAGSYPRAPERLADTRMAQRRSFEAGRAAHQENRLHDAVTELEKAGPYSGAKQRLEKVKATLADQEAAFKTGKNASREGRHHDAVAAFQNAGSYPGAVAALEQAQAALSIQETAYQEGVQAAENGRLGNAITAFKKAGSYPDAAERLAVAKVTLATQETAFKTGQRAFRKGLYGDAVAAFQTAGSFPGAAEALQQARALLIAQEMAFSAGETAYRRGLYEHAALAYAEAGSYPGAANRLKQAKMAVAATKKTERITPKKKIEPPQNDTKVYPLSAADITWFEKLFRKDSPTPVEAAAAYYQWVEWLTEQSEMTLGDMLAGRTQKQFINQKPFPVLTPTLVEKIVAELESHNARPEQIDGVIFVLRLLSPNVSVADAFLKTGLSAEMKSWVLKQLTLTLSNWVYPFIKQAGQDKVATDVVETNQEDPPISPSDPASPKTKKRFQMGRERLSSADGLNSYEAAAAFSQDVGNNPLTSPAFGRDDVRYNNRRTSRVKPRVVSAGPPSNTPWFTPREIGSYLMFLAAAYNFSHFYSDISTNQAYTGRFSLYFHQWVSSEQYVRWMHHILPHVTDINLHRLGHHLFIPLFELTTVWTLWRIRSRRATWLANAYEGAANILLWIGLSRPAADAFDILLNASPQYEFSYGFMVWKNYFGVEIESGPRNLITFPTNEAIQLALATGALLLVSYFLSVLLVKLIRWIWDRGHALYVSIQNRFSRKAVERFQKAVQALDALIEQSQMARKNGDLDTASTHEIAATALAKEIQVIDNDQESVTELQRRTTELTRLREGIAAEIEGRNKLLQKAAERIQKGQWDLALAILTSIPGTAANPLIETALQGQFHEAVTRRDHEAEADDFIQALDVLVALVQEARSRGDLEDATQRLEDATAFARNAKTLEALNPAVLQPRLAAIASHQAGLTGEKGVRKKRLDLATSQIENGQEAAALITLTDVPGAVATALREQARLRAIAAAEEALRVEQAAAAARAREEQTRIQHEAAEKQRLAELLQKTRTELLDVLKASVQAQLDDARTAGQERLVQVLATNLSSRETFEQQQAGIRARQEAAARQHIQADRLSRRINAARERRNAVVENDDLAKRRAVQQVLRGIFLPKTAVGRDLINWLYENGILTYSAADYTGIHTLRQLLVNEINETFPTLALSACGQMAAALLKGKRPFYILNRMKKDFSGIAYNSLSMEESWVIADLFKLPGIIDEAELLKAVGYSLTDSVHFERAEAAFSTGDFLEARVQLQKANDPADGRTQEMEAAIQAHIQVVLQDPNRLLIEVQQWLPTTVRWPTGTDGIDLARWAYPQILTTTNPQDMQARLSSATTLPLFLARVPLHILFPSMSEMSQLAIADQFMNARRPYSLLDRIAVVTSDYPNIQFRVGPTHAIITLFAQKNNVSNDKLPAALHDILSGQASAGARILPIGKPRRRSLFGQLMGTFDINEVGSYGQSRQERGDPFASQTTRRYSSEFDPGKTPTPYFKAVGARAKELRLQLGFTQKAVGEAMGWTEGNVSAYETTPRPLQLRTLRSYARALNVPLRLLLDPSQPLNPKENFNEDDLRGPALVAALKSALADTNLKESSIAMGYSDNYLSQFFIKLNNENILNETLYRILTALDIPWTAMVLNVPAPAKQSLEPVTLSTRPKIAKPAKPLSTPHPQRRFENLLANFVKADRGDIRRGYTLLYNIASRVFDAGVGSKQIRLIRREIRSGMIPNRWFSKWVVDMITQPTTHHGLTSAA